MKKMTRILIGGKSYPIVMDINVLEHIQDEYGSINEFERDILGIKLKKDKDGNQEYTEEGKPKVYRTEPSIKAIKTALPLMINEGLSIEAEKRNSSYEEVSDKLIFRECTISFEILADMIHDELIRCFETKK